MSMTKRYLESLPKEEQDNILGLPDYDEWDDSAENEPMERERMEELWWEQAYSEGKGDDDD